MGTQWFVYTSKRVDGPFAATEIEDCLKEQRWPTSAYIWSRAIPRWITLAEWEQRGQEWIETAPKVQEWYYRLSPDHAPSGPFNEERLLAELAPAEHKSLVLLRPANETDWQSIYEIPHILQALGLSRRKYFRVPLSAQLVLRDASDQEHTFPVSSVSLGGLGFHCNQNLPHNIPLRGRLESDQFPSSLYVHLKVLYQQQSGQTGACFDELSMESQSVLSDYIRRWEMAHDDEFAEAA